MGSDPDKMISFNILSPAAAPILAPRLGSFAVAGRKTISTPHYIPLTTRGAVSHIAHDVMRDQTAIGSLYIGLEDCILPISYIYHHLLQKALTADAHRGLDQS
jgi:queuine tRNA-ribosyltransferase